MSDFRQRAFLPVVLPLAVIAGFLAFAFSLSRVFLATPPLIAALIALSVAIYILLVAAFVSAKPRLASRSLGVGLVLGLVGVIAAGTIAGAAGPHEAAEDDHAAESSDEAPATIPDGAAVWVADGLEFIEAPTELEAGTITVALDNRSGLPHNVTFEGVEADRAIADTPQQGTDVGTVELPAGEYTYYCSIVGHREAGMEGAVTVK
ncbi:MAG TPA: plastocyanin/azurin family copper-binding protein [Egibacteraceae bacterium]|nr:plastocyanin/azurin family copper-binding protein [Egibacteraceae bacterium]